MYTQLVRPIYVYTNRKRYCIVKKRTLRYRPIKLYVNVSQLRTYYKMESYIVE